MSPGDELGSSVLTIVVDAPRGRFERWAWSLQVRVDRARWRDVPWGTTTLPVEVGRHLIEFRDRPWPVMVRTVPFSPVTIDVRDGLATTMELSLRTHSTQIVERPI